MSSPSTEEREQSIATLFRELSQESAALVRDEIRLVREDLAAQARRAGAGAGLLAAAGALGAGSFGALTAALISGLGRGRTGRGALLVAGLYGAGAAASAMAARERLAEAVPEAADTLKRDVQAAAQGVRSAT